MKNFPAVATVLLTVFIDLLSFGIILPLLPSFSVNVLHMNEFLIGLIAGVFSLMQFFFNPVWGSLSDRLGRKPIITISLAGSVLSNLLLAFVFSGIIYSVLIFILSRAFAGVFAANISAAQAVISDVTPPEKRTKGMGMVSAAFALGFVFGPAIGGILSENYGYSFPVFISAALSFIALLMSVFFLKETLPEDVRKKNRDLKKKINSFDLKKITALVKNKSFGKYIIIFFVSVFSFSNIFGTLQLFSERKEGLNLSQQEIGYLFSFMGIIGVIVQLFLLKLFDRLFGEEKTLLMGCLLAMTGLGLIGFSESLIFLLIVIAVMSVGNGLNNTVAVSLLSQKINRDEQGTVLGVNQSLSSLARFLGPVWGGFVYQYLGYKFPFITGGVFMFLISVYTYFVLIKNNRENILQK